MAEVKNAFIKSKMNKDLDSRLIPNGEYRDAKNIQVSRSQGDDVGALENIFGNSIAVNGDFATDSGVADIKCIGYVTDETNNFVYLFFTNYTDSYAGGVSTYSTSAQNFIYAYNTLSNQKTKLLQGSFLNFSTNRPIIGVNVLENLLFWTDNRNQPRKINIDLANSNGVSYYNTEDKISVAKYNPYSSINLITASSQAGALVLNTNTSSAITDTNVIPVNSNTNVALLFPGLGVTGSGVSIGTFVTAINGFNITVNQPQTLSNNAAISFVGLETTMYDAASQLLPSQAIALVNGTPTATSTFNIDNLEGVINVGAFVTGEDVVVGTTVVNWTPPALQVSSNQTLEDNTKLFFQDQNPYYESNFPGDPQYLEDKFVRFSYRFKFIDGEYSIIAPFTQEAFIPKQDGYFINGDEKQTTLSTVVDFMENKVNKIDLQIPLPSQINNLTSEYLITDIDIIYKESDSTVVQVVETIPISSISGTDSTYVYTYLSQKPYKTLPSDEIVRVYDKVPVKALGQEIASNRVIYSNFQNKHTPPDFIDYQIGASQKQEAGTTGSANSRVEYPNHNLKENRNYQVGIVLSDKFGRQSTVILSNNTDNSTNGFGADTIYLPYRSTNDSISFAGNSIKTRFNTILSGVGFDKNENTGIPGLYNSDSSSLDYNPLGWYSYKIVVKQTEQEYYNVYTAGAIKGLPYYDQNNPQQPPLDENTTFITLLNDNINKIPRDLTEVGAQDKQYRSSVRLFGRVENTAIQYYNTGNEQFFPKRKSFTVNQIEDLFDAFDVLQFQDNNGNVIPVTSTNSPYYAFFRSESNPFIAELVTSTTPSDQFGVINLPWSNQTVYERFENLNVFETKPTISRLDIYWETSTSGLISDLNIAIGAGAQASQINNWNYYHTEAMQPNSDITGNFTFQDVLGADFTSIYNVSMTVTNDAGEDVTSKFNLVRNTPPTGNSFKVETATGELFYYSTNNLKNIFNFVFLVTVNNGDTPNTVSKNNQPLTNIAPTITYSTPNNQISMLESSGIAISLITGVNGSADSNLNGQALTYSIAANSPGQAVFAIGPDGTSVINTNSNIGVTYPDYDDSFTLKIEDNGSPTNLSSTKKFFVTITEIP